MAKKRLNRKVALIGSVILGVVVFFAIMAFLFLSRDPHKFISDGDAAFKAGQETADPNQQTELYEQAERNYRKAYGYAKTDELKVETLYRLVDLFKAKKQWREVVQWWAMIVRLDSKDMQARYSLLKYLYIVAQGMPGLVWQDVATQASEFIELIEKPGTDPELATTDPAKWEIDVLKQKGESGHRLGPYLHLIRARANLDIARLGLVTNKDESLKQATTDLEKVKQLEPENAEVYLYLAQTAILRGDIEAAKGNLDARDRGHQEALVLLKEGVGAAKDVIQANISLLEMKHALTMSDTEPNVKSRILTLETDYLDLVNKYGSNPEPLSAIAGFYADYRLGSAYLDKAIEALEKASMLDQNNVDYALLRANLYSKRYNIHKQKSDLNKAIETAIQGLSMPDAQETTGPRAAAARAYQIRLNSLLALNYLEQILVSSEPLEESEGQRMLEEAQKSVRQIEQLFGSGDDPQIIKWQGMIELAEAKLKKGDASAAIRKLYSTYTQLKVSERSDPSLSYVLAKTFVNSTESGAAGEFLSNALVNRIEILHPEARLDYAEMLNKAMLWKDAIEGIEVFEQQCGATDRSRILRIAANIGANDFEEAERNLEKLSPQDANGMVLKAMILTGRGRQIRNILQRREENPRTGIVLQKILSTRAPQTEVEQRSTEQLTADMKSNLSVFIEYMDKLLAQDPNLMSTSAIASLCEDAMVTGQLDMAKTMVDKYLKYSPDSTTGMFYKRLLAEADPANTPDDRRTRIREEVLSEVADPVKRALALGVFYQSNNDVNKATELFKKLAGVSPGTETLQADDATRHLAAGFLFETAVAQNDWQTADRIIEIAKRENIDNCSGDFFAARAAFAKGQYETALASIDSALAQRPVFGYGYLLRSRINGLLGKEDASLADIRTASTLNPWDKTIARELASRLYQRNQKLGSSVSSAQLAEARNAINVAIALNPNEVGMMSFYAEYISESNPEQALALRQSLQENSPSMQNALLLAQMATRLALDSTDPKRQEALKAMAISALEEANSIAPQNPAVLESYAEFYRRTGQQEKAEEMLTNNTQLLWRHYFKSGQYDDAKKVLERMYADNPKDINTIKGLLYLAERSADREGVKKHSEQLLSADETPDNHLLLVQSYLNVGLVSEAEQKLAGFRERYPADSRGLLLSAWVSMKQGHLKESLELVNKRLEGEQSDATAWRLRGNLNYMLADYDQAIMDLKRSKTLMDISTTRVLLARTYLRAGRTEDAITELKGAIEDPQTPDEARVLLEEIYMRTGRKEAAKEFYAKVLEILPDSIFWHKRAGVYAGATGDYATAQQEFEIALQKSNEQGRPDADALGGYLRALLVDGKIDKMTEIATKYIDGNLATVAYIRLAEAKIKIGDKASAVQFAIKAVDKARTDEEFTAQLQNMLRLLGQQDTESFCRQLIASQPESYKANLAMYNLFKSNGDYNKAVEYVDKCINAAGTDEIRWLTSMMQKADLLTLSFYKTSDNKYLNEAVKSYESVLSKRPNNTYALNNVAYILADNNVDIDKAMEYAKRAYEARPDDPGCLDTYALVLYKKGQYADAVRLSQSSLQQYEAQRIAPPTEAYEHLGQSLEQIGEFSQARAAYEQALETGGERLAKPAKERITAAIERIGSRKSGESK